MIYDPAHSSVSPFQAQTELELLQLILQESISYPSNPAEPETEDYFAALEQEVIQAGWSTEELTEQGQVLSAYLDQAWSTVLAPTAAIPVQETVVDPVSVDLFQQFAAQVPQPLLERIAQQARQVISLNLNLADQLVQCVQDILPNWADEDLQVLARPFAFAMRGAETEMLEAALRSVRCAAWTELSGVEQARLSLAIARYAISQMPSIDPENN